MRDHLRHPLTRTCMVSPTVTCRPTPEDAPVTITNELRYSCIELNFLAECEQSPVKLQDFRTRP